MFDFPNLPDHFGFKAQKIEVRFATQSNRSEENERLDLDPPTDFNYDGLRTAVMVYAKIGTTNNLFFRKT